MQLQAGIADSWQIQNAGKSYVFYLNRKTRFSNGKICSAYDVMYSFQRLRDTSLASPGAWIFENRLDSIKGFELIDSFTFAIHLKEAFAPFLSILSTSYCGIVCSGTEKNGIPIGSGPFQVQSWERDGYLILEKNTYYAKTDAQGKSLPYLDRVVISTLSEGATEFLAFLDGKIDMILDIDASFKDIIFTPHNTLQAHFQEYMKLETSQFLNTEYIGIYAEAENAPDIIANTAFRRAMAYALPKSDFVFTILKGKGSAASGGLIPAAFPGFDSAQYGIPYDPAQAKAILDSLRKEGIVQTQAIPMSVPPTYAIWAESFQSAWKAVGIQVSIDIQPNAVIRTGMREGKLCMFRASWIADYPDPENYASLFVSTIGAPPNYTRFANPEVDALYTQAVQNQENRNQLYRKLDSIAIQSATIMPIVYDKAWRFVSKRVRNAQPDRLNRIIMEHIQLQ